MTKRANTLRWLAFALTFISVGVAAEEWFQVEVIGFRYADSAGSWASDPVPPDFASASLLAEPASEPDLAGKKVAFAALPAHALTLAGAYRVLARAGDITPVFHVGWLQRDADVRTVHVVPPVDAGLALAPLEGTVQITGNREALQLRAHFVARVGEALVGIHETRKLMPGELHYLDHALAGVLVQVTALTPSPDEASELAPSGDPVMPD